MVVHNSAGLYTVVCWATCRNGHTTQVVFGACTCCPYVEPQGTCEVCTQPVRWSSERRDDIESGEVWEPEGAA